MFDLLLVGAMILETWLVPLFTDPDGGGSGLGNLAILRLLRLMRLTRMVRLMRSVPELLVLLKGIASATKAVGCTLLLLTIALYIFGIIFRMGMAEDPDFVNTFGSLFMSMYTLFSNGTLCDNV